MKSILLVGKGPSAVQANTLRQPHEDVAVINDAARYINGLIHYCFFIHDFMPVSEFVDRIDTFVSPEQSLPSGHWSEKARYLSYKDSTCERTQQDFINRIVEGGICHHHTTTAALHWLAKYGDYFQIRILGVDGGRNYAPGAFTESHRGVSERLGPDFLDDWKSICKELTTLLSRIYGVTYVWLS